ncbi:hypothetical protein PIROE2DRAFT_19661 [Piromyces sp. E2]|nr:hypothetical protein PIROE2DRAFT_19661 [Piromyces sp. E2]|eukprot:OUM69540.1 hypothetical protein PIROE2DRAFT_19661 [Piromyces sp. E2]
MQLKSIIKFASLLFAAPVFAGGCEDIDKCPAEILIVATKPEYRNEEQNQGLESVRTTLEKFSVSANKYEISPEGVSTEDLQKILYDKNNKGRYKAIIFPNGRVSYSNGGDVWSSAIRPDQWKVFTDYSAQTKNKIVYLNEYPSNNTGTELAYDFTGNPLNYKVPQPIIIEDGMIGADELNKLELTTEETWHFPAKITPNAPGFTVVEPLMYFGPNNVAPEQTIGAVACETAEGAKTAAFFTSFGSWSRVSAALNIYWLTWVYEMDFSKISEAQYSTEDAIRMAASDAPRSTKLGIALVLSTISAVLLTLF